jgi:DegV family protein with EDD domain
MLRIVMDGAGDMPPEWAIKYDIRVIPVNIQFGEQTFLQGVELSDADFYRLVEENDVIPKTSQPTPQQFVDFYKNIAVPGDTILSMHVTGKLSGTFDSAQMAAAELAGMYDVIAMDSYSGSAGLGYMCQEARMMEREGASIEKILKRMDFIRQNITIVLTLDTLEYAKRSGRVKTLQAAIASILDVKPIVVMQNGVLDMAKRVRTRKKSIETIIEMVKEKVGDREVNVAIVHAQDVQTGQLLMAKIVKILNISQLIMTNLSISVAANLGPGTVGIVAYPIHEG